MLASNKRMFSYDPEITFSSSSQGRCGVVTDDETGEKRLFKVSKNFNYITGHEALVMEALNPYLEVLPHFPISYGLQTLPLSPMFRNSKYNPFDLLNTHVPPISVDLLFMELIKTKGTFTDYLSDDKRTLAEAMCGIMRMLVVLKLSQDLVKFTHYDLHTDNILMRACDYAHCVYKYRGVVYIMPTFGVSPVIIDFGYAFCEGVTGDNFMSSLDIINYGVVPLVYNSKADMMLLLRNSAETLEDSPLGEGTKLHGFRRMMEVFKPFDFLTDTGHVKVKHRMKSDLLEILGDDKVHGGCRSFNLFFDTSIDMVMRLVDFTPSAELRLRYKEAGDFILKNEEGLRNSYRKFLKEFVKIETLIGNSFYVMYTLRVAVDYIFENRLRLDAEELKKRLIVAFNAISMNIWPKDFTAGKFLEVFTDFVERLEGVLNALITKYIRKLNAVSESLEALSIDDFLAGLVGIQRDYSLVPGEKIKCFDIDARETRETTYTGRNINFKTYSTYATAVATTCATHDATKARKK